MSAEYHPQVVTGLSLSVAGIVLTAEIDEEHKTAWIVQSGEVGNGEQAAVDNAVRLLAVRIERVRPDLRMESSNGN
jgi:hypothetical protein